MLQTFAATTSPTTVAPRVAALRAAFDRAGVDGFVVPRADIHMGEFVAPRDERLAWLTSFTGSAGFAVVLRKAAALFIDGRYTLQARAQSDTDVFDLRAIPMDTLGAYLVETAPKGAVIGFDPRLHGKAEMDRLTAKLEGREITLKRVDNLVDAVWHDQPVAPKGAVTPHPARYAGAEHSDKRAQIGAAVAEAGADYAVLSLPESLSWLLNIRGADLARTPSVQGFGILDADGALTFFCDPDKLDAEARAHLGNGVSLAPIETLAPHLAGLEGTVLLDKTTAPLWIADQLDSAQIRWGRDPCTLPKACKSEAELAGTREAHLRDGVAMARFLHWLDTEGPKGGLTEIDVVRALEGFRQDTGALKDIAFETICGAGANGAIVHYRVNEGTNAAVTPGELLLIDSGGQYLDGTTDITRTVPIGPVRQDAIKPFTLVLRGMIQLSQAHWPDGLAGRDLDAIARGPLWSAGLDYDHGTGHGVGAYLGVHEGPQNISRRGTEPLRPGMILSNEPGYYREGAFGIRLENLVVVRTAQTPSGGDRPMLSFETITFAPLDRRLIDSALLGGEALAWLDAYHAQVLDRIGPACPGEVQDWLAQACAPLS